MTTLSIIKADVDSIGGHVAPSAKLVETISRHIAEGLDDPISDYYLGTTGDDIAILMVHDKGTGHAGIHRLPARFSPPSASPTTWAASCAAAISDR